MRFRRSAANGREAGALGLPPGARKRSAVNCQETQRGRRWRGAKFVAAPVAELPVLPPASIRNVGLRSGDAERAGRGDRRNGAAPQQRRTGKALPFRSVLRRESKTGTTVASFRLTIMPTASMRSFMRRPANFSAHIRAPGDCAASQNSRFLRRPLCQKSPSVSALRRASVCKISQTKGATISASMT